MTPQPPLGQPPVSPVTPGQQPPMNYPPRGPLPPGMMPPGMLPPGGMPMMMMPPPQPPRGNGVMYAILVAFATSLFVGSLMLNVVLTVIAAASSGAKADPNDILTVEQTILEGNSSEVIAVVRLAGVIEERSKREFVALLNKVSKDSNLKALVLEIDSPGGGVTASDEMYDAVMRLKQQRGIPVVVSMSSVAASGGYYVSMAADRVLAQETTLTGSIGVIFQRYDLSGLGEKYGVRDGSIIADGATYKNAGSPLKPLTADEEAYFKSVINDAFGTFKARIAKGRPAMTPQQIEGVANGKIYSAQQALALKLVDKIGYLDDAIAEAAKLASLSKPKAVRVDRELTLLEQLGAGASAKLASPSATSGGATLTVSPEAIDQFARPRLMYLWSGN